MSRPSETMTKPITPAEARKTAPPIPPAVFEVINTFIAQGAGIRPVTVRQKDIVEELVKRGLSRDEIFEKHWLDVEGLYEAAGWKVEYDKPGYNETYDAYFVFTPKGKCK